jgi:membrane-associated PAP2 superfamily phosphatase
MGFSLLAFYFVWRRARPARARRLLAAALAVGAAFAYAQTARGAHFLSHDLVSLALAWLVCTAIYALGYGRRLHPDDA